jgi:hypothetical protein
MALRHAALMSEHVIFKVSTSNLSGLSIMTRNSRTRRQQTLAHALERVLSDPIAKKPEPSDYPALAAFDIKVDRKSKFQVLLLAIATVCRTIANARLQSELTKGVVLGILLQNPPLRLATGMHVPKPRCTTTGVVFSRFVQAWRARTRELAREELRRCGPPRISPADPPF